MAGGIVVTRSGHQLVSREACLLRSSSLAHSHEQPCPAPDVPGYAANNYLEIYALSTGLSPDTRLFSAICNRASCQTRKSIPYCVKDWHRYKGNPSKSALKRFLQAPCIRSLRSCMVHSSYNIIKAIIVVIFLCWRTTSYQQSDDGMPDVTFLKRDTSFPLRLASQSVRFLASESQVPMNTCVVVIPNGETY